MADQIGITIEPNRLQVKPGERATATVLVTNASEEVGQYRLYCEGLPTGWAEISPDQVSAFPLEQVSAQIILHPPREAPSAIYTLGVSAVLLEHAGIEARTEIQIDSRAPVAPPAPPPPQKPSVAPVSAPPPMAAQIEVLTEPVTDAKLGSGGAQWRVKLRNAGLILDTFGFNVSGVPAQWVSVVPPEVTLKPEEEGSALLTVQPEEQARPATYPFTLRTYSHLNLNERTDLRLQVVVQPCTGFRVEIAPPAAEAQGRRDFAVSLRSDPNSNVDLTVGLSASDQDDACEYVFEPQTVQLPARSSATSKLSVRPLAVLSTNERRTIAFHVVAAPEDGAAVSAQRADGQLTQVGAKPLTLALQPQVQTTDLEADYKLLIMNPSGVEAALSFSGSDPENACQYFFRPPTITLPPRTQAQVQFKVKSRTYYDGEGSKMHAFTVAATREGEIVPAATAAGQLVQSPIRPLSMQLVPPQQSRSGDARYTLRVSNPRPSAVSIWLEAADEADALAIRINPPMLNLSPNAQGAATVSMRPKDRLMVGEQRRVHKFTVNGRVEGPHKPLVVNGVLAQTASATGVDLAPLFVAALKVSLWLLRWLIALLLLVLLGNLFFSAAAELACRNPTAQAVLNPIMYNPIGSLFYRLPFSGLTHLIVRFAADLLAAFVPAIPACYQ